MVTMSNVNLKVEIYFENKKIDKGLYRIANSTIKEIGEENTEIEKIVYVSNLSMFMANNREKYYTNVFKGSKGVFHAYVKEERTLYRWIEGIDNVEDFENLVNAYFSRTKNNLRYYNGLAFSISNAMFKRYKTWTKIPNITDKNIWVFEENIPLSWKLYNCLIKSFRYGYFFNECDPDSFDKDYYAYDFKAFHCSILYSMPFPKYLKRIKPESNWREKYPHFLTRAKITIEPDSASNWLKNAYCIENNNIICLINEATLKVIERECKVINIAIDANMFFQVTLNFLSGRLRDSLAEGFKIRESAPKELKKYFKLGYEKFAGECGRTRHYIENDFWNEKSQQFEECKDIELTGINGQIPAWFHDLFIPTVDDKGNKQYNRAITGFDLVWYYYIIAYSQLILQNLRIFTKGSYGDSDSCFVEKELNEPYYYNSNVKALSERGIALGSLELKGIYKKLRVLDMKYYAWYDEEDNFKFKSCGIDKEVASKYFNGDINKFTKVFPANVKPFKYLHVTSEGKQEYRYRSNSCGDGTQDCNLTIAAAGCGKTTELVEKVKEKIAMGEPCTVLAFTKANVDELIRRIGSQAGVRVLTIDSLAHTVLNELDINFDPTDFKGKLEEAINVLKQYNEILPATHLFVDEFQDEDSLKLQFIELIPALSRYYIGDPNQSIYGYDGAVNAISTLKNANISISNICYRCPQNIIDFAEQYLLPEKRPHAKSVYNYQGKINITSVIPDDGSVILCRTNAQVKELKQQWPEREITTIHKAKGCTYDKVTVIGIHASNEEESNIAYVACTRAKYELTIIGGC